jgi:hypothetical protein
VLARGIDEAVVTAHHMRVPARDFLALVRERLEALAGRARATHKDKEGDGR